jgi:hypothetical protein
MIPSDVASRLQVTADAALRPVANVQEITDKLAGLAPAPSPCSPASSKPAGVAALPPSSTWAPSSSPLARALHSPIPFAL